MEYQAEIKHKNTVVWQAEGEDLQLIRDNMHDAISDYGLSVALRRDREQNPNRENAKVTKLKYRKFTLTTNFNIL